MDLRRALNAVSDVVANRPPAIREFDQIYMKHADLLLQAELISKWFNEKDVVFIGDGDAIGLCLTYLYRTNELSHGPKSVHILDFDERVINSVKTFAEKYSLTDYISAELYNVFDPLPEKNWGRFNAFYTNPPFGATNGGDSIKAFVRRGLEACHSCYGCVVIADSAPNNPSWVERVLYNVQSDLISKNAFVVEMLPRMHTYHLDDDPELTSCSIIVQRSLADKLIYNSNSLDNENCTSFYGAGKPLTVKYVRDKRKKLGSSVWLSGEYELELTGSGLN